MISTDYLFYLSVSILSILVLALALGLGASVVGTLSVGYFIPSFFVALGCMKSPFGRVKWPLIFLLVVAVYMLLVSGVFGGFERAVVYFLILFSYVISIIYFGVDRYFFGLSCLLAVFSPILYIMYSYGLVLENYPAAFSLPLFLYVLFKERVLTYRVFIFLFLILIYAEITGARTVQLASVLAWLTSFMYCRVPRLTTFLVLLSFTLGSTLTLLTILSDEIYYLINEDLTYRPTIWRYYYSSIESLFFGSGMDIGNYSTFAADDLSYELGRGVAERYGVHSFYMSLLFSFGIIGLVLTTAFLSLITMCYLGRWPALFSSVSVVCFFTSSYLGYPSIYGILLIAMIAVPFDSGCGECDEK